MLEKFNRLTSEILIQAILLVKNQIPARMLQLNLKYFVISLNLKISNIKNYC